MGIDLPLQDVSQRAISQNAAGKDRALRGTARQGVDERVEALLGDQASNGHNGKRVRRRGCKGKLLQGQPVVHAADVGRIDTTADQVRPGGLRTGDDGICTRQSAPQRGRPPGEDIPGMGADREAAAGRAREV